MKRRRYEKEGLLQTWSSRRVPYKRVGLMEWRSILFVYLGSGALANTWSENFQLCKVRFNVGEAIFCALFLNCFHSSSIFLGLFFIQRNQLLPPTILANISKFLYILSITCIPHFPYRRCVYSTSQTAIQSWKLASYFVTQAKISVSRKTGNMLMTRGVNNCFDFMPEATQ